LRRCNEREGSAFRSRTVSTGCGRASANGQGAVSDRDFAAEYLFCASTLLSHLSRMAEDLPITSVHITADAGGAFKFAIA